MRRTLSGSLHSSVSVTRVLRTHDALSRARRCHPALAATSGTFTELSLNIVGLPSILKLEEQRRARRHDEKQGTDQHQAHHGEPGDQATSARARRLNRINARAARCWIPVTVTTGTPARMTISHPERTDRCVTPSRPGGRRRAAQRSGLDQSVRSQRERRVSDARKGLLPRRCAARPARVLRLRASCLPTAPRCPTTASGSSCSRACHPRRLSETDDDGGAFPTPLLSMSLRPVGTSLRRAAPRRA